MKQLITNYKDGNLKHITMFSLFVKIIITNKINALNKLSFSSLKLWFEQTKSERNKRFSQKNTLGT